MIYSAGTVDQWPKNVSCALMYGGMWTIPVPDLDRTDYLLMLGANPHASQGSLLAAPDVLGEIDAIRARGGTVVVIDPRRTGTADRADEWIPIAPRHRRRAPARDRARAVRRGAACDLGDARGPRERRRRGAAHRAREFTPEAVGRDLRHRRRRRSAGSRASSPAAPRAAVYGRIGTCNQEFGTLASWLVDVVNMLTGNFDRAGRRDVREPDRVVAGVAAAARVRERLHASAAGSSRVRGAPEVLGQVPVSCLAEEIATPGDGPDPALITIAGNPVLSAPDAATPRRGAARRSSA